MKLCLSCWRLSPRDATHCSYCGKTFGAKLCRSKKPHRNPFDAKHCAQCGSADLTEPTRHLSCGCVGHLLAWGVLLLILWGFLTHGLYVMQVVAAGGLRAASGWLHGASRPASHLTLWLHCCLNWTVALIAYYITVMCLLSLLPDEVGKPMQKVVSGAARLVPNLGLGLLQFLRGAFKLLGRLVYTLLAGSNTR